MHHHAGGPDACAPCRGLSWDRYQFLGLSFTSLLIHSLLSSDNDLKMSSRYFPQIPPVAEVSCLVIPLLIWAPCVLLCLPGIWRGEIRKYGMPRLNKACSFQLDLQCLCYTRVAKITTTESKFLALFASVVSEDPNSPEQEVCR